MSKKKSTRINKAIVQTAKDMLGVGILSQKEYDKIINRFIDDKFFRKELNKILENDADLMRKLK